MRGRWRVPPRWGRRRRKSIKKWQNCLSTPSCFKAADLTTKTSSMLLLSSSCRFCDEICELLLHEKLGAPPLKPQSIRCGEGIINSWFLAPHDELQTKKYIPMMILLSSCLISKRSYQAQDAWILISCKEILWLIPRGGPKLLFTCKLASIKISRSDTEQWQTWFHSGQAVQDRPRIRVQQQQAALNSCSRCSDLQLLMIDWFQPTMMIPRQRKTNSRNARITRDFIDSSRAEVVNQAPLNQDLVRQLQTRFHSGNLPFQDRPIIRLVQVLNSCSHCSDLQLLMMIDLTSDDSTTNKDEFKKRSDHQRRRRRRSLEYYY